MLKLDHKMMKSIFRNLSVVLSGLIILYGLGGCITSPVSISTSVNPTDTKVAAISSASPTLTPFVVATTTRTPTLIPPAPTAISTLSAEDASTEILRLLSSADSHCQFPCWWGITPGQTRIVDAQNYFDSFGIYSGMRLFDNQKGSVLLVIPQKQNTHLDIDLQYDGKDGILKWLRVGVWRNMKVNHPNGDSSYEISWGDPELAEIIKPYSLSNVFATYGKPSEVLVFTHQETLLNQPWPISLIVFYPEQGFMIEYVADDRPVIKNPGVMWCPSLAFPYFWFWSPSKEISIKDVASWIDGYQLSDDWVTSGKFKTLEDATGMTIDELYSSFISDENTCITTPAELWPMPGE